MITTLLILFCLIAAWLMLRHFGTMIYNQGYKAGKCDASAEHIADIGRARADATMAAHRAYVSREVQNGRLPMDTMDVVDSILRAKGGL